MDAPKKTIDGFTYEIEYLPTGKALRLWQDIAQKLAPAGGDIFKGDIGHALTAVAAGLPEGWIEQVSKELAKVTTVHLDNGKAPRLSDVYETHFRGAIGRHFRWLIFAIEAQYSDFLGDLSKASEALSAFSPGSSLESSPKQQQAD